MLYFHCALTCEAKPIIEAYRLKATVHRPFKIYQNEDVTLLVSGIGKINTAAAISYAYGRTHDPVDAVWINVGIAGSSVHEKGTAIVANKISDADTQQNWYPPSFINYSISRDQVTTYAKPHYDYTKTGVYDMEAAAFAAIATRFSTAEWVQSIKIISDNSVDDVQAVSEQIAAQLIERQIDQITQLSSLLRQQNQEWQAVIAAPDYYNTCLGQWRLTVTEQQQLRRLLQRATALDCELPDLSLATRRTKAQFLSDLRARVEQVTVVF